MSCWVIELFHKHVGRDGFTCGEPALDTYLATYGKRSRPLLGIPAIL
jgi:hypothetical protein